MTWVYLLIAGLLEIVWATFLKLSVIKRVFLPNLLLARAASIPACPPPTTIISYILFIILLFKKN